jgi:uncharacterized membrane protein YgcG
MKTQVIFLSIIIGLLSACSGPSPVENQPAASAVDVPERAGSVSDFEQIFTPEQADTLRAVLAELMDSRSIEVLVVTTDSALTFDGDLKAFTKELSRAWEPGKEVADRGMIITMSNDLGTMEVNVRKGMKETLNPAIMQAVFDSTMVPLMQEGEWYRGTLDGLRLLAKRLE